MAKVEAPVVSFDILNKAIRKAENNQKRISATVKQTGSFNQGEAMRNALNQIERVQKINPAVWGDGFEVDKERTLAFMWELVGRIQTSKAPMVERENAESWTREDREAYENAIFVTLEEAEREGY